MSKDLKVILFVSRNKDNKLLPDFKERRKSFLSDKSIDELAVGFNEFVNQGLSGEMCRFYQGVNNRDNEKIRRSLIHYLVDNPELNMSKVNRKIASLAAQKENASEKKWLFDFDEKSEILLNEFLNDIRVHVKEAEHISWYITPNGYAVVVNRGFDTRELLKKWSDVSLKRDDMLCVSWKTKR